MTRKRLTNPLDPSQVIRELEKVQMHLDDFRQRYRWLFDLAYFKRHSGGDKVSGTSTFTTVEIVGDPELGKNGNVYAKRRQKLARALEKLQRAAGDIENAVLSDLAEGTPGSSDAQGRILSKSEIRQLRNRQIERAEQGGGYGIS